MEEEDFTDAGDDAFRTEDMTAKKSKTSIDQGTKKRPLLVSKSTTKFKRTLEEKSAALARRNAWLQNMFQQKPRI